MVQCGVSGGQVGVVTPYRYQQRKIKEALSELPQTVTSTCKSTERLLISMSSIIQCRMVHCLLLCISLVSMIS